MVAQGMNAHVAAVHSFFLHLLAMDFLQSYRRFRARLQHRRHLRQNAQVNEQDYADLVVKALRYSRNHLN